MLFRNKMVVGFELNNDYSQLSFCALDESMPDTLSLVNGAEEYNIPTALLAKNIIGADGKEEISFSIGREIRQKAQETDAFLIEDFFGILRNDASVMIGESEYSPADLFRIYIKKCLAYLTTIGRREEIVAIGFNTSELTTKFMDTIKLGISEIPVYFLSKQECFYQYMLHQQPELRLNDCLLFELRDKELNCLRLEFNHRTKPIVGLIEEKTYMISQKSMEEKDNAFEAVIKEIADTKSISSSFLIGEGFSKEWCKNSLKELCRLGRAFQGNNLFSKGACYYTKERVAPGDYCKSFIFLGEDKLKINVGMNVNDRGQEKYLPLLNAGTNWYEAGFEQDFIISASNTITLSITPINGEGAKTKDIFLEYFDIRQNNTNRINMKLKMVDKNIIHIEVTDLGFGDIYPSKGTVWKDDIKV